MQRASRALLFGSLVGWLCLTSHRQRGHLETALPFTVPCGGREARFVHRPHRELNPESLHGSPLHYRCATPALRAFIWVMFISKNCEIKQSLFNSPIIISRYEFHFKSIDLADKTPLI